MSQEPKTPPPEPHGPPRLGEPGEHPLSILLFSWMRTRMFYRFFMGLLLAAGILLVVLEAVRLIDSPRAYLALHNLPGFFGVFGFLAFCVTALSGWPFGKLLRRPEDYYDTSSGEAGRDR